MIFNRAKFLSPLLVSIVLSGCADQMPSLQGVTTVYAGPHDVMSPKGSVIDSDVGAIPFSNNGTQVMTTSGPGRQIWVCEGTPYKCQDSFSYKLTAYVVRQRGESLEVAGAFMTTIGNSKNMTIPFHQTVKLGEQIKLEGLDGSSAGFSIRKQPIFQNGR